MSLKPIYFATLLLFQLSSDGTQLIAATEHADLTKSEECEIGVMVKAIQSALKAPQNKASLEVIARYGTDSRYYVMIRGWLVQELAGVQSQLDATRDDEQRKKFQQKADFLHTAIRRIDLE